MSTGDNRPEPVKAASPKPPNLEDLEAEVAVTAVTPKVGAPATATPLCMLAPAPKTEPEAAPKPVAV